MPPGKRRDIKETPYDIIFDEERPLIDQEYANLRKKQSNGYMSAHFFRRNMFNARARGERIQYKRPKVVWEKSEENKVAISHSLHQKHADVLSLIHTDYLSVSKPDQNGGYSIYLSLYGIAKAMGYKYPSKATDKVKQFILDLRWTDFVIYTKDGEYRTTILDDAFFSESKDVFVVAVKGKSAKILAHTTGIKISKELTHKIVQIPDSLVRLKAMIRYIISNKQTVNGYTMNFIFEKFDIGNAGNHQVQKNDKSNFRRQLKENKKLLSSFNLRYDEVDDKVYYQEQLDEVQFELAVTRNPKKIIAKIEQKKKEEEPEEYDQIGKKILIRDTVYIVVDIQPKEDGVCVFKLKDTNTGAIGTAENTLASLDALIRDFVDLKVRKVLKGGSLFD